MQYIHSLILFLAISCSLGTVTAQETVDRTLYFPRSVDKVEKIPRKENVWVFILAGQSNMAGRGLVEPQDTLPTDRVLTITANGQVVFAKEPLHFYEPKMAGLDCGLSFGRQLIQNIPKNVSVLLIPTAIGGSSISQWLGDSVYRNVQLLSNFQEKVKMGKQYGEVKGILWHQGESDAHPNTLPLYQQRLSELFSRFRAIVGDKKLPILIGEIGTFSTDTENIQSLNRAIKNYVAFDSNTALVSTADLKDKGDKIHFNSEGQRLMGQRFANAYIQKFK